MVDILDMEDIFHKTLSDFFVNQRGVCGIVAKKLIKEVSDFVEAQQTIKCNSCDFVDPAEVGEPIPWGDLD